MWPQIVESLKPLARAIFKPASVESVSDNVVTVRLPANMPLSKAEEQKQVLVESVRKMCGAKYTVSFTKDDTGAVPRPDTAAAPTIVEQVEMDDLAPVDPADILPGEASDNLALDALHEMFPGGRVEKAPAPRGKKK